MGRSDRGSGGSAPPAPADVLPCPPGLPAPAEVLPASAEVGPYPPPGECLKATIGVNVFFSSQYCREGRGSPKGLHNVD